MKDYERVYPRAGDYRKAQLSPQSNTGKLILIFPDEKEYFENQSGGTWNDDRIKMAKEARNGSNYFLAGFSIRTEKSGIVDANSFGPMVQFTSL